MAPLEIDPRDPAAIASDRRLALWTLLGGLALWGAMCWPLSAGRVYTSDDLGAYHLPLRKFYAECLARGEAFDWCPQLYGGFYLSGEGQVGMYHPLHQLLYRWLRLDVAFDLELLIGYPLMLAGMYLFLHRWLSRRAAAMFGAVVFTFSGFNTLHFVHPQAVAIVAHLPWLLWCWDIVWRQPGGRRAACGLAGISLLTASQILLGYPQYAWFSLLAQLAYAVLLWRLRRPSAMLILQIVAALMLGALAAAVQWLPTWDLLADSQRRDVDAAFALTGALHPVNLIQLMAPYLFRDRVAGGNTHEFGLYLGAAPLMLVAWYFWCQPASKRSSLLNYALALAGLALVLALGAKGGLYLLQTWLPVIGKFRLPARYLVLVHFGLATVSAVAFDRLLESSAHRDNHAARKLWKLVLASLAITAAAPLIWGREQVASGILPLLGPLLMAAAAGAVLLCQYRVRWAYAALLVLTLVDLGGYGVSYAIWPNTLSLDDYLAAGSPPELSTGYRVATEPPGSTLRSGNHLLVRGCHLIDGYAGLEPRKRLDYRQIAALQLAGVQWQLDREQNRWIEVAAPLPRARLVSKVVATDDPARDLQRIDPRGEALVEQPAELSELSGSPGKAEILSDRPGEIRLRVASTGRQLLVVGESFHAGWHAIIDGSPAPVLRVNGDFVGCVVEPGEHDVALSFKPQSLLWGRRLSLAGLLAIGLVLVLALPRQGRGIERASSKSTAKASAEQLAGTI